MPGAVSPAPVPAWIEKHVLSYSQFRVKIGLQKNLFTTRKGENKMDFEEFIELTEEERKELIKKQREEVEKRMGLVETFIKEVADVQLNLNHDGYEEVTIADVLKAYEIIFLLQNG